MEIQINNYPAEIELDNERTVKDVVDSLNEWIAGRNLIFIGVEVDGNSYHIDEIPDISLESVKVLNCFVNSRADIVYDTVNEGMIYCDRVVDFLVESGEGDMEAEDLEDMVSGMEWLQEVFHTVAGLLNINLEEMKFRDHNAAFYVDMLGDQKHAVVQFLADTDKDGRVGIDENLFNILKEIFAIFLVSEEMKKLIVESIDSPDVLINSLREIRENLPGQAEVLEQAAVSYQKGNDAEGVEKLFQFIDFMFSYTRTCYQIAPVFGVDMREIEIDGVSLDEVNRELHNLMNDTLEAIENNDMISLADILEYEIRESIENLEQYIEQLLGIIIE